MNPYQGYQDYQGSNTGRRSPDYSLNPHQPHQQQQQQQQHQRGPPPGRPPPPRGTRGGQKVQQRRERQRQQHQQQQLENGGQPQHWDRHPQAGAWDGGSGTGYQSQQPNHPIGDRGRSRSPDRRGSDHFQAGPPHQGGGGGGPPPPGWRTFDSGPPPPPSGPAGGGGPYRGAGAGDGPGGGGGRGFHPYAREERDRGGGAGAGGRGPPGGRGSAPNADSWGERPSWEREREREGNRGYDESSFIRERIKKERPCRTLFVRNIGYDANPDQVRDMFDRIGEVKTFFDLIGSRGMAFVTFYDLRPANISKERLNNLELGGRKIDVHFSLPRDVDISKRCERDKNQGTLILSIRNPTSPLSEPELWNRFSQYGELKNIVHPPEFRRDERRIEYWDSRAAERALDDLHGQRMAGGTVVLEIDWDVGDSMPPVPPPPQGPPHQGPPQGMMGGAFGGPPPPGPGPGPGGPPAPLYGNFNNGPPLPHHQPLPPFGGPPPSGPSGGPPPPVPVGLGNTVDERLEQAQKIQQLLSTIASAGAPPLQSPQPPQQGYGAAPPPQPQQQGYTPATTQQFNSPPPPPQHQFGNGPPHQQFGNGNPPPPSQGYNQGYGHQSPPPPQPYQATMSQPSGPPPSSDQGSAPLPAAVLALLAKSTPPAPAQPPQPVQQSTDPRQRAVPSGGGVGQGQGQGQGAAAPPAQVQALLSMLAQQTKPQ
ncbi:hypothetical protein T439DRAFT_382835 [Meredithblackwellia eburnea MCA 4105]